MIAEHLLELIEKYEDRIEKINDYLDNNDPPVNSLVGSINKKECYEEFIRELEHMLNTSF